MKTLRKKVGEGVVPGLIVLTLLLATVGALPAQGILTLTPGRSILTTAGTGSVGYSGDNGVATSATLASPSAVAFDSSGNLFLADTRNHVIREIAVNGNIATVAGNGIQGFAGDGGPATSAQLDSPTGVAIDASGNLYIADSHNHRIRKVTGTTISTVAGTGAAGFSGDGGAATSATLSLPSAVALDGSGNLYIADTNNQRIRKVSGTTITTVAGNGDELFQGDGSLATAASLDGPTGVAVDGTGNLYIADRHNQRIRMVDASGTISTIAGSGAASFAGGFSGDGASSTAAMLARPSGVSVDASGNVTIADTGNQRIRQVSGNTIATLTGSGQQGFGGDSGIFAGSILNAPRAVATDATGNLAIADRLNQRIRSSAQPILTFPATAVGSVSVPQTVTLANTGDAPLTVSTVVYTGVFATVSGGSCPSTPITLAPGTSCTESVAYAPISTTPAAGSITIANQTILLKGSATAVSTQTTLVSSTPTPFVGQPVTFTATVTTPTPLSGTVTLYNASTPICGATALHSGMATFTTTFTAAGSYSITAVYSGDTNSSSSTSPVVTQLVGDFDLAVLPDPTLGSDFTLTLMPGGAGTYSFTLQPLNSAVSIPITLSATGLPPGATATFSPQTLNLGSSPASFSMKIQTAKPSARLERASMVGVAFGLLLLPFSSFLRKAGRKMNPLMLGLFLCTSVATLGIVTGCGSDPGLYVGSHQTYLINVVATAQGSDGEILRHITSVKLIIE